MAQHIGGPAGDMGNSSDDDDDDGNSNASRFGSFPYDPLGAAVPTDDQIMYVPYSLPQRDGDSDLDDDFVVPKGWVGFPTQRQFRR